MKCYQRLLNILYKDHFSNKEVCRKIQAAIGEYNELLTIVKRRKAEIVSKRLNVFWLSNGNPTGHSERKE